MPTGAVTLLEAAKCGRDALKTGVVQTLIQESPILEMIPFQTIMGNALEHSVEESLPTTGFRKVNATWTKTWGTDTKHFWGVAIMGGEVEVDNFIVNTMGNVTSVKAQQFTKKAKSNSRTFDKYFFDGDGTADDFKGVNTLIAEGFGQELSAATDGAALSLDLLDQVMDLLRTGAPDALLVNRFHRRKITGLARSTYSGYSLIDVGTDMFGRKINTYDGVPMRLIGDDATGTALLGFDETHGASSVASSLYAVRWGEDLVSGLLGANGHMDVRDFGEQQAAPTHLGRIEWYPGIAVFDKYAIVRLSGILQS